MKKVIVLMCLMIATTAFGYGLDGTLDVADFDNYVAGTREGDTSWNYWKWEFTGGTAAYPLSAELDGIPSAANQMSPYDPIANYSSDGATLTHTPPSNWGYNSTGFYKPFNNGYYIPQGTTNAHGLWEDGINDEDGFTVEWRMALGPHAAKAADGLFMQFDVTDARDGWIRVRQQEIQFGAHGWVTAPTNTELMNTYRIACLGVDPDGDPCAVMGNLYQNQDLLFEEVQIGTVGTNSASSYLWAMVDFGDALYYYDTETDYVSFDIYGAWAPVPEPATMLLLLGGGLLSLKRRRK
jgi:hypothetical protein